jgi:hypothetical protein
MDFKAFLISKKIDPELFSKNEPDLFLQWDSDFVQMHPKSFEARKLFLINQIRRKYRLKEEEIKTSPAKPVVKPVIKPKIKR